MSPKLLWIIIGATAVIIIAVLGYFALRPNVNNITQKDKSPLKLQTYRNTQYGFEFAYPTDIYAMDNLNDLGPSEDGSKILVKLNNIKQKAESVACSCGEVEFFEVAVVPNPSKLTAVALAKKNYPDEYYDNREVTIAGYKALGLGEIGFHYLIAKGDYILDVYPTDDILPTLKFTK